MESREFATFGEFASSLDRMTSEFDAQNGPDKIPDDVESRLLDDDRRRGGEFLRDYLARHRVEVTEHSDE